MRTMGRLSWRAGGALLLFLCVAVVGAAALTAEEIDISPGELTITAGDGGGMIGVEINDGAVTVDRVTFTYLNASSDPSGKLSVTDSANPGPYQTVFSSTKAGDASIKVTVHYRVGDEVQTPIEKEYDHIRVIPDAPYQYIAITREGIVPAGGSTPITVRMKDRYGNVINDETGDTVDFWVSVDGAEFQYESITAQHVAVPFSASGNCTVTFQAPEKAVPVIIRIDPGYGATLERLITIDVVGERVPVALTASVVTVPAYPIPFQCLADGESYFRVNYLVTDRFGNGIEDYPVDVSTNMGESVTIYTAASGYAMMNYGPRTAIGTVTMMATAGGIDAEDLILRFTGGTAEGFEIIVNPSNIPSADTDASVVSSISARVNNIVGTGVAGETVNFKIKTGTITNSTIMTDPVLTYARDDATGPEILTVTTDEEGYATVYLHAGAFPEQGEEGFDPYALGSCIVDVSWNGKTKNTGNITWRNYPYLRVETSVSADVVAPGDTLDVTIHLIGDGNNYQDHGPIDVVICLDRGEDMLISEGLKDRMEIAREAAMILVTGGNNGISFDPDNDRVALITYSDPTTTDDIVFPLGVADILTVPGTFNWKKNVGKDGNKNDDEEYIGNYSGNGNTIYNSYATVDFEFGSEAGANWINLHDVLWKVVPIKKDDSGQASAPLRLGLAKSIQYIEENSGNPEAVKAIVLLMQNNYRYFGDPFAEGPVMTVLPDSNTLAKGGAPYYQFLPNDEYLDNGATVPPQNMVEYAKANGIKIYAIYYPSGGSVSDEAVPKRLAEETGGEYFFAGDEAALEEAFHEISLALLREAGIHTSVDLTFAELPDDVTYTATDLLSYEPYTNVDFFNWTTYPYAAASQEDRLPGFAYVVDQTDMWEATGDYAGNEPGTLQFEVGNVSVKQTWMTQFSLMINASITEPINFTLFAPGSMVEFESGEDVITEIIPAVIVTVMPGLTPQTLFDATIDVDHLNLTDWDASFAYFEWPINYTGSFPLDEQFYIRRIDGEDTNWKNIGSLTVPMTCTGDTLSLYTADLEKGLYEARIKVSSADAGYDEAVEMFPVGYTLEDYYILLT
ncbi:hypothetical protein AZH53_08260 [Methanomicrobiaceae archaeon CYW5]|nr:hypothetical protein [Methanovulcanius yangii]